MLLNADLLMGLSGLLFTGVVYGLAHNLEGGARFFPIRILGFLALSFFLLFCKSLRERKKEILNLDLQATGVVVLSGLYLWAMLHWGYVIPTALFCFLTTSMLGFRRYALTFTVSVGMAFGCYVLFTKLLSVPLPHISQSGFF